LEKKDPVRGKKGSLTSVTAAALEVWEEFIQHSEGAGLAGEGKNVFLGGR